MSKTHTQYSVSRLQKSIVNRHIGLRPGMRLHICMLCPEKLFGALYCKLLHHIDIFAAAVISFSGIALSIFVCKMRADSGYNCGRNKVLRSNKLDMRTLTREFLFHCDSHFGI